MRLKCPLYYEGLPWNPCSGERTRQEVIAFSNHLRMQNSKGGIQMNCKAKETTARNPSVGADGGQSSKTHTLDLIRFPATEHEKDILLKRVNIQLAADNCT